MRRACPRRQVRPDPCPPRRDSEGREVRLGEIAKAVAKHAAGLPYAGIIPVRTTEAWLLVDEREIRRVAGNPNGKIPLGLPVPSKVESVPDPKQMLKEKLILASGLTGRRLEKLRHRFPQNRRLLLERIEPRGPIAQVPSWCSFVSDVEVGLKRAAERHP